METVVGLLPVLMCLVATNVPAGLGTLVMDFIVQVCHKFASLNVMTKKENQ